MDLYIGASNINLYMDHLTRKRLTPLLENIGQDELVKELRATAVVLLRNIQNEKTTRTKDMAAILKEIIEGLKVLGNVNNGNATGDSGGNDLGIAEDRIREFRIDPLKAGRDER